MKLLRNKKTGEIGELQITEKHYAVAVGNGTANCNVKIYCTLDRLNEEWEDYKEPKEYWYIDIDGGIMSDNVEDDTVKVMREIGNYFDTREEAEKAVEKLRAWKVLKDMGFKIVGIRYRNNKNYVEWDIPQKVRDDYYAVSAFNDALHLLFGGEE